MMYKLINRQTSEKHLCDKVTIDGYDYYVSDKISMGMNNVWVATKSRVFKFEMYMAVISNDIPRLIIATNDPNIDDVSKVVDEVERLANWATEETQSSRMKRVWKSGYNKSQETHPFSEEDMIEFVDFVEKSMYDNEGYTQFKANKELFQLWKEQRIKTLYYE